MKHSHSAVSPDLEVCMWYVIASGDSPGAPSLHPDAGGLPGAATLQRLADGIGGWALIAAMMGIVVGAVIWAFGRQTTRRNPLLEAAITWPSWPGYLERRPGGSGGGREEWSRAEAADNQPSYVVRKVESGRGIGG